MGSTHKRTISGYLRPPPEQEVGVALASLWQSSRPVAIGLVDHSRIGYPNECERSAAPDEGSPPDGEAAMFNVSVVGLGWWGRIIVKLLAEHPQIRVTKGVDTIASEAANFADLAGIDFEESFAAA